VTCRKAGAAVGTALFRPSSEQAVLVVAATDVDAVRTVLQPQLPGRLCVVPSRWTRAQLDDVMAHLSSHADKRLDSDVPGAGWKLEAWGQHADEHGQPYIQAHLFRVTADPGGLGRHSPGRPAEAHPRADPRCPLPGRYPEPLVSALLDIQ
jgi:hypothetical protein